MPNIDDFKFKKKTFRPWDKDILSQLKIEEPFKKEEEKHDTNLTQTEAKLEPKLSDLNFDKRGFKGKGIRPYNDKKVVKPKPDTNLTQSDNKKKVFIPITRRCWDYDTPENKPDTNLLQSEDKPTTNLLQTDYKLTTKPTSNLHQSYIKPTANLQQSGSKLEANCKQTGNKVGTNLEQSGNKLGSELGSELGTNPLSNSNDINNKYITTTEKEFTEKWEEINFEVLSDIGFSKTQLKQLYDKNLNTPEIIQESIHHFAFGLKHNEKTKEIPNPLYRLMGVLRKGNAWTEDNYESAQDIAMREHIERLEREKEQRRARNERIFELKFDEWFDTVSVEDLKKILTAEEFKQGKYIHEIKLKTYFRREKWEDMKEQVKQSL